MAPFVPEPHWFVRPGVLADGHPGLLNPTFDLLDYPIVMGRADEACLRAQNAAAEQVELSYQDALDRVAKIAGVLRLLGVGVGNDESEGQTDSTGEAVAPAAAAPAAAPGWQADGTGPAGDSEVYLAPGVPELAASLVRLAVFRIGGTLTHDDTAGVRVEPGDSAGTATGAGLSETQRKGMRRLASHVEGVRLVAPGLSAELDVLVRDGRVEPSAALELPADLVVERTAGGSTSAANATF